MEEEAEPEVVVEPEDPEYEHEEHVQYRRKQEVTASCLEQLFQNHLSEFRQTMAGDTYAYTRLALRNMGITELTDIVEKYPHLRKVDLASNLLKDASALSSLEYLVLLDLSRNWVSSIGYLFRQPVFPFLKEINLLGNQVKALPTISLKNLKTLNLNYNCIESLEEFDGHLLLEKLQLRGNKIKCLQGLAKIPSLLQLYIAENQLIDLKGIKQAPRLCKIHARKNKIATLIDYPEIEAVKYLNLRENLVATVGDLKGLKESVETINLLGTPLEAEKGEDTKKEVWMIFRSLRKINKQEMTSEEEEQFATQYKERLAEIERERLERQAAQREAQAERQAAEREAAAERQAASKEAAAQKEAAQKEAAQNQAE